MAGGWFEGVRQYFRQQDGKVYRLYEDEERLILDFGLAIGDTIEIGDDFGGRFEFFPIRMTDTTIYNQQLRKLEMRVKPENEPVSNVPHVWIEGVGDTGFFFGSGYVFGNLNSTPLFCVRDNGPFYSAGMQCPDLLSSTHPIDLEVPNFIYSPMRKMLVIKNKKLKRVDLFSISGERINSYGLDENNNEIDISSIFQKLLVIVLFDGKSYKSNILKI